MIEHSEQRRLRLTGSEDVDTVTLLTDAGATEDDEPDQAHSGGHQDHAYDELADGAAPADAGKEHPDEGAPRDPPRPVEDCPRRQPLLGVRTRGRRPRRHCREISGVITECG